MTPIASEAGLREWLRREWLPEWGPLIWCEAARGGTVGAPDVFVPVVGYGYVPVELKYWPRIAERQKGKMYPLLTIAPCRPDMRPAQRRLHTLLGESGFRSAVLSYIGFGAIGVAVGWEIAKCLDCKTLKHRNLDIYQFRELLSLKEFWRKPNAKLARTSGNEQQRKEHRSRTTKAKRRV